ncbi:MAG: CDP-alcohol phosphatidyltransferase family protein [Candidatus Neomarinimicrobiota bacterium]
MPIKAKITDPTKILTFANMISLGRAVLAVPIVYTLRDPSLGYITFSLIIIAVLSDTLDGWFARQAQEVTHFWKMD